MGKNMDDNKGRNIRRQIASSHAFPRSQQTVAMCNRLQQTRAKNVHAKATTPNQCGGYQPLLKSDQTEWIDWCCGD